MMERKYRHDATITKVDHLDEDNVFLTLNAPELSELSKPGQFVELETSQFLNRPFGVAICDKKAGTVGIGVRKVGKGTKEIFEYKAGDKATLFGPFGYGFSISEKTSRAYVVGGGTGIYPLLFLLQELKRAGIKTYTGCGFQSLTHALMIDDFSHISDDYLTACEIGEADVSGTAVDALAELYERHGQSDGTIVYACGPIPMLKAVNAWCEENGIDAECSFEARMGCGFGVCRGCAIPVIRDGQPTYDRCCVEGPVFRRGVVDWEGL